MTQITYTTVTSSSLMLMEGPSGINKTSTTWVCSLSARSVSEDTFKMDFFVSPTLNYSYQNGAAASFDL